MYASLLKISQFFTNNPKNESCKNKASWWGEIKWKNNDRKTTCVGNSKRSSCVRSSCFSRTYDYIDFVHIFLWQVALQLNFFYQFIIPFHLTFYIVKLFLFHVLHCRIVFILILSMYTYCQPFLFEMLFFWVFIHTFSFHLPESNLIWYFLSFKLCDRRTILL